MTKPSLMIVLSLLIGFAVGCDQDKKSEPAPAKPVPATAPATKPIIPQVQVADWCPEHGVPESVCTRCNASLIPTFKAKGDWCEKHNLPHSQDITCHPEVAEKWKAMAPKKQP